MLTHCFDAGEKPQSVTGNLELRDVAFAYPQRLEVPVFTKLNLRVQAGTTVALVGPSGSGKSTVVSLVQRFYDPTAGQVSPEACCCNAASATRAGGHFSAASSAIHIVQLTLAESKSHPVTERLRCIQQSCESCILFIRNVCLLCSFSACQLTVILPRPGLNPLIPCSPEPRTHTHIRRADSA